MPDTLDSQIARLSAANASLATSVAKLAESGGGEVVPTLKIVRLVKYAEMFDANTTLIAGNSYYFRTIFGRTISNATTLYTAYTWSEIAQLTVSYCACFPLSGKGTNVACCVGPSGALCATNGTGNFTTILDGNFLSTISYGRQCNGFNGIAFYSAAANPKFQIFEYNAATDSFSKYATSTTTITGNLIACIRRASDWLILSSSRAYSMPLGGGTLTTLVTAYAPTITAVAKVADDALFYTNTGVGNALVQRFDYGTLTSSPWVDFPGFATGNAVITDNGAFILRAASNSYGEILYRSRTGKTASLFTDDGTRTEGLLCAAATVAKPAQLSYQADGSYCAISRDGALFRLTVE